MSDLRSWLPPLTPSAQGYARLASALERRRERRVIGAERWRLASICAGLAVVAVALLNTLRLPDPMRREQAAISANLEQALANPAMDLAISDGAAIAVPIAAPNVRFYWVAVATGENANHNSSSPSPSR